MFGNFLFRSSDIEILIKSCDPQSSTLNALNASKMFLKFEETKMYSLMFYIAYISCNDILHEHICWLWPAEGVVCLSFFIVTPVPVKQRRSADHRLIKFETLGSDTVADVRLCTHTHTLPKYCSELFWVSAAVAVTDAWSVRVKLSLQHHCFIRWPCKW